MTPDPLDRLRACNPLPEGSSAPPLDSVLAHIQTADRTRTRRPRAGALIPVLGAAAALAVALVALGALHQGTRSRPTARPGHTPRPTGPAAPAGGMRGVVEVSGVGSASAQTMLISLQQCQPCHAARRGGREAFTDWQAITRDSGRSWTVTRRPWLLSSPAFSGLDGWAQGLQLAPAGGGIARFYASHDGGRSWRAASSSAAPVGEENVSLDGGEAWSFGSVCGSTCTTGVVRGPVAGNRLQAPPVQPITDGSNNLEPIAVGPGAAYVTDRSDPQLAYVTHDNGSSWERLAAPCPAGAGFGTLSAAGASALWEDCALRSGGELARRSTDGGRHWQPLPAPPGQIATVDASSARVAWALTEHGGVLRTADGGRTWSAVWSVSRSQAPNLAGHTPLLTVENQDAATVVVSLTRGRAQDHPATTNLVVYATSDGGATWGAKVLRLPPGGR